MASPGTDYSASWFILTNNVCRSFYKQKYNRRKGIRTKFFKTQLLRGEQWEGPVKLPPPSLSQKESLRFGAAQKHNSKKRKIAFKGINY